jgi:hypothetical protein
MVRRKRDVETLERGTVSAAQPLGYLKKGRRRRSQLCATTTD